MTDNAHEQATETILAALRNVEPAPGMNDRLLRALQQHSEAPPHFAFRKLIAIGLAATAAIAIAMLAVHKLSSHPTVSIAHLDAAGVQHSGVRRLKQRWDPPVARFEGAGLQPRREGPAKKGALAPEGRSPLSAEDQLALDELNAPSKPAPPLPLTAQEKLLLNVVGSGDTDEYALLNPDLRAANERKLRDLFPTVANFQPYPNP